MDQLLGIGTGKDCPVAIFIRDGRMLVGLRHYTPEKWKAISVWTVPGGRCENNGETLEETLRREVREEIGVTDFQIVEYIGSLPGAMEGDTVHLFGAETTQEPRNCEEEKFSEWKWIPLDEMPDNFINPPALDVIRAYRARMEA